jgi:hypothetical protein
MRTAIGSLLTALALAWPRPAVAQDGLIGLFADSSAYCLYDGHEFFCDLELPPSVPVTLYVLALPSTFVTAGGITGAEFRIAGAPPGLMLTVSSGTATIVLGNPFTDETLPQGERGGVNVAWSECQIPNPINNVVLLFTVEAVNVGNVTNAVLTVTGRDPPNNPNFPCPLINACDPPQFTAHCVSGWQGTVNRTTELESRPWSAVKALYR